MIGVYCFLLFCVMVAAQGLAYVVELMLVALAIAFIYGVVKLIIYLGKQ